ncbi:10829_t:CDS:2 [Cetraspora pellucida]|uniref:10829_t:CDS:1 n=1 Tax=Cetraspora pellucida TaxID=1433469 RepID=A0A9N9D965_9GLOM|nr:10829_t:CDS:2 [Cetraspora pellucida]
MPELPEVESVRRILRPEIIGKKFQKVEIYKPKDEVNKREKLLTPEQKQLFEKHNNESAKGLTFYLESGLETIRLTYRDARRFGGFRLQTFEDYKELEPYKNIGTDLLDEKVDAELLFKHYQKRKIPIKNALLEQKIISGIGNIYASEILFDTKIHPLKKINQLTESEVKKIVCSAQIILKEALNSGGTSEFDFVNPLSKEGSYQNKLKVYNRKGKPCHNNCGSLIEKLEINQEKTDKKKPKERSTFFCPRCQPLVL